MTLKKDTKPSACVSIFTMNIILLFNRILFYLIDNYNAIFNITAIAFNILENNFIPIPNINKIIANIEHMIFPIFIPLSTPLPIFYLLCFVLTNVQIFYFLLFYIFFSVSKELVLKGVCKGEIL